MTYVTYPLSPLTSSGVQASWERVQERLAVAAWNAGALVNQGRPEAINLEQLGALAAQREDIHRRDMADRRNELAINLTTD